MAQDFDKNLKGSAMTSTRIALALSAALPLAALFSTGCASTTRRSADETTQRAFMENIAAFCGGKFEGRSVYMSEPQEPLASGRLVMHVASCEEDEIRIPLAANEDRTRTWILTMTNRGLLLKHDHRDPDGTEHDLHFYGGYAQPGGSAFVQSFPADNFTKELIPEASTNIWTIEIRPEANLFVYSLTRHGQPRFSAVFNLSERVDE